MPPESPRIALKFCITAFPLTKTICFCKGGTPLINKILNSQKFILKGVPYCIERFIKFFEAVHSFEFQI